MSAFFHYVADDLFTPFASNLPANENGYEFLRETCSGTCRDAWCEGDCPRCLAHLRRKNDTR